MMMPMQLETNYMELLLKDVKSKYVYKFACKLIISVIFKKSIYQE